MPSPKKIEKRQRFGEVVQESLSPDDWYQTWQETQHIHEMARLGLRSGSSHLFARLLIGPILKEAMARSPHFKAVKHPTAHRTVFQRPPKGERVKCGAQTRKGTPCQSACVWGKSRCRLHGGCSTGPTTAEGRARIAESNRRRAKIKQEVLIHAASDDS
ncbi:MAG: HGGxSTG domain-containing protein [Armatimonadota bacterium]